MTVEVMLMQKAGAAVSPVRIKYPENEISALLRIKEELGVMVLRCQGLLLTAAESAPDEQELDAIQERLGELREELATITGG
jgi:hypothetical protein